MKSSWAKGLSAAQLIVATLAVIGLFTKDTTTTWLTPVTITAWMISAYCCAAAWIPAAQALQNGIRSLFEIPWLGWLGVIGLLLVWLRLVWASPIQVLPPLWAYLPFALSWSWLTIGFLLAISDPQKTKVHGFVGLAVRLVTVLVITVAMLEILLNIFVTRLPVDLIERAPLLTLADESRGADVWMPPQAPIKRYRWAGSTAEYTLDSNDGDLYRLTCLEPPDPPQDLYEVKISFTEEGFRQTTEGDVDMVVIGDSFTFAYFSNEPYWMNIYPDVLSMGITGSGSLEQAMLLEAFGAERHPKVVLMAFFEGNDMQDTWRFSQAVERYRTNEPSPSILKKNEHFRPLRFLSTYSAGLWLLDESKLLEQIEDCPYPIEDAAGNRLAFYDLYMSMSTVDTDTLRESDVYAETRAAILSAAEQAQAMEATFILMFIPTKFHVHYPMLLEAGAIPRLAQEFDAFRIGNKGFVPDARRSHPDQVADLVAQNIDNQRTLLKELAQENDFLFLDLTPALQDAAAQGFAAYGDGDTHWDQEGNEFVRGVIREFLAEQGLLE